MRRKSALLWPISLESPVRTRVKFRGYRDDTQNNGARNNNHIEENVVKSNTSEMSPGGFLFIKDKILATEKSADTRDKRHNSVLSDMDAIENPDNNSDSEILEDPEISEDIEEYSGPRPPRAVQAAYLRPLRRQATFNIPVCDLQLRSYSVRNVEFMSDFAMRAAYFLDLPATGPIPLPQITERWTVPKAHFIHKKVQENFERKTLRRLIQIKDGNPDVVRLWLGFLRKHAYYGVGMKANVWEFAGIGRTSITFL